MKQITRKRIDETISKVATQMSQNISSVLIDNINLAESDMDKIGEQSMKDYILYIATMKTALQMSTTIMKETLYELLCDE